MRWLALDIGNSKVAAGVVERTTVIDEITTLDRGSGVESQMAAIFDPLVEAIERHEAAGVVVSSVMPRVLELFQHLWWGRRPDRELHSLVVTHEAALPYVLDVDRPDTVGADRLCNVAAAVALGFHDAILVDLGTANTFDLLRDGWFVGGLIGPGAERSHRALIEAGSQLPDVPFAHPRSLVGRDTARAMQAGSFHQAVGAVSHVVRRLRIDRPDRPALLAGGLAETIGPELPFEVLYVPHMTLVGAARIAEENHGGSRP
jgi:type III pantothenate kinase